MKDVHAHYFFLLQFNIRHRLQPGLTVNRSVLRKKDEIKLQYF